jgi:hypothetical protein
VIYHRDAQKLKQNVYFETNDLLEQVLHFSPDLSPDARDDSAADAVPVCSDCD